MGITRQSVQRIADFLVECGLAEHQGADPAGDRYRRRIRGGRQPMSRSVRAASPTLRRSRRRALPVVARDWPSPCWASTMSMSLAVRERTTEAKLGWRRPEPGSHTVAIGSKHHLRASPETPEAQRRSPRSGAPGPPTRRTPPGIWPSGRARRAAGGPGVSTNPTGSHHPTVGERSTGPTGSGWPNRPRGHTGSISPVSSPQFRRRSADAVCAPPRGTSAPRTVG